MSASKDIFINEVDAVLSDLCCKTSLNNVSVECDAHYTPPLRAIVYFDFEQVVKNKFYSKERYFPEFYRPVVDVVNSMYQS